MDHKAVDQEAGTTLEAVIFLECWRRSAKVEIDGVI
jgi:hypothetical protein